METITIAATQKNMGKKAAYALAHEMIQEAIDRKCPLQAIAIEESILTDRISSTLNVGIENGKPYQSLGKALYQWNHRRGRPNSNAHLFDASMEALYPNLDNWCKARNKLLHGMAKSFQCEAPDIPIESFREDAMEVAVKGYDLVKKVSKWVSKKVKKAKAAERKRLQGLAN